MFVCMNMNDLYLVAKRILAQMKCLIEAIISTHDLLLVCCVLVQS